MQLPITRQINLIADLLAGRPIPTTSPTAFSEPWRDYFLWVRDWLAADPDDVDLGELKFQFSQYLAGSESDAADCARILAALETPATYPAADTSLAAVQDLRWLWPGWLLRGLPSLLAAAPGTGKSYLALDLAQRIIAGTSYPDGAPVGQPGPVLYVDAENTPSINKERLTLWPTSHKKHLFFMLPDEPANRFVVNLDDFTDRDRLRDMCWIIRPRLVIVDSYGSCTLRGENNKEDVQVLLAFFTQLSRDFDCGLLVVHHLRKAGPAGQTSFIPLTIDSIRGSSHIVAMARHIWGLQFVPTGPDPDDNGPRRLWVMKSNVGPPPQPMGISFKPHPENEAIAQLHYGQAPRPFREPTRVDDCADWLLQLLVEHGEPIRPADVIKRGQDDGYYQSLVYRARKHLGDLITDTRTLRDPNNMWALPEMDVTND